MNSNGKVSIGKLAGEGIGARFRDEHEIIELARFGPGHEFIELAKPVT